MMILQIRCGGWLIDVLCNNALSSCCYRSESLVKMELLFYHFTYTVLYVYGGGRNNIVYRRVGYSVRMLDRFVMHKLEKSN